MPFLASLLSALLSGIAWLFRNRIGQWIAAALAWFGLSIAVNEFAIQPWLDMMRMHMGQVTGQWGAVALDWFGVMRLDICASMVASAVAAKYGLQAGKAFLTKA